MLRFRRYRVFVITAILLTLLIFRLSRTSDWQTTSSWDLPNDEPIKKTDNTFKASPATEAQSPRPVVDVEKLAHSSEPSVVEIPIGTETPLPTRTSVRESLTSPNSKNTPEATGIDPQTLAAAEGFQDEEGYVSELHEQAPGKIQVNQIVPPSSTIHWTKPTEHFPVPPGSRITLPSGRPKQMPKIQHTFAAESDDIKLERERRQALVKKEFVKAWEGYKTKAWMHDELSPRTGGFRDPFCGWAATLVDSLDTLWIMGLEEEFATAVRAVEDIDFTTSPRADIPLFETTIRYLGGLLAAYDVSEARYPTLLEKAVELAEILIGAFDTPNRMPVLYYRWKPAFASQPHRASTRANLAELGSLSMEFTRLAQLTKENKYYDAVARVTNALEEFQNRGTRLDGIFPDVIDASGCNRSAPVVNQNLPTLRSSNDEAKGYEPAMPMTVQEPKPQKAVVADQEDLELQITPGQPGKGRIETTDHSAEDAQGEIILKRADPISDAGEDVGKPEDAHYTKKGVTSEPTSTELEWDCIPQGLSGSPSGSQSFSMGGGQDSTYEYLSKQYLLLGGLEDKYRTMYLKTMDAVREHLLFRPMVPDNRDILFSGKLSISGNKSAKSKFEAEITHLTCFLGGMVGMGARLFGIESDIEISKKLSDGCVWAYEIMDYGVMPEVSQGVPCQDADDCTWSKEMWWRWIDPQVDQRESDMKEYEARVAKFKEEQANLLAAEEKFAAEEQEGSPKTGHDDIETTTPYQRVSMLQDVQDVDVDSPPPVSTRYEESLAEGAVEPGTHAASVQKRQVGADVDSPSRDILNVDEETYATQQTQGISASMTSAAVQTNPARTTTGGYGASSKSQQPIGLRKPLTHEEYVTGRIEREGIPPGLSGIRMNYYILRPEAIESVWYMYRITGDPTWQDKGWQMFENIINITKAEFGHSAVKPVTGPGAPKQINEMESFWLAETLKYFYLLYSTPNTISLDEWVLNTEAHPFRRPDA